jgi:hypothetical protein
LKRHVEIEPLTPAEILEAPAGFASVHEVRSIGPAIVLVLEHEGPMRMEFSHSTEAEFHALRAGMSRTARHVLDEYFEAKAEEEGTSDLLAWEREEEHAARLAGGSLLTHTRVSA